MTIKLKYIASAMFFYLGGCAVHFVNIDFQNLAAPEYINRSNLDACVIGYVHDGEMMSFTESPEDFPSESPALVPNKRADIIQMRQFIGQRVNICARIKAEQDCWTGQYICVPYGKPYIIEFIYNIQFVN